MERLSRRSGVSAGEVDDALRDARDILALVKLAGSDVTPDPRLDDVLKDRIEHDRSLPVATALMADAGVLDAFDEAGPVLFREFRRSSVPTEDVELLRHLGLSPAEIELLLLLAVEQANELGRESRAAPMGVGVAHGRPHVTSARPNGEQASTAAEAALLDAANQLRLAAEQLSVPPRKRRKLLNGIGKIVGGAGLGVANVLMLHGVFLASSPALGATALGSCTAAFGSVMAGMGDLRGE
jgi:hypothetical protein